MWPSVCWLTMWTAGRCCGRGNWPLVFGEVEGKENLPREVVECSRRLQTLQRSPSPWLTLWAGDRAPDLPLVGRGVQALGLRCNPFGPERAEMDPLLGEYGYRPPAIWGYLSSPQPMVVLGGPGSGKTATALLLAYDCQFPPSHPMREEILPVYLFPYENPLPSSDEASCRHLLEQVARAVAEALLQTIARHPYLFAEQNPGEQAAIASLWIACLGRELRRKLAPHLLRAACGKKAREKNLGRSPETGERSDYARRNRVAGVSERGPARRAPIHRSLDGLGAEPGGSKGAAIARSMEAFLKVVPALAARGVYIKAFLPRSCRPSTVGDSPVPLIELTWPEEDLREMLAKPDGVCGRGEPAEGVFRSCCPSTRSGCLSGPAGKGLLAQPDSPGQSVVIQSRSRPSEAGAFAVKEKIPRVDCPLLITAPTSWIGKKRWPWCWRKFRPSCEENRSATAPPPTTALAAAANPGLSANSTAASGTAESFGIKLYPSLSPSARP